MAGVLGVCSIVFFDLETTGLNTSSCDVLQLSAVHGGGLASELNVYILPHRPISDEAARITGFTRPADGPLLLHGRVVVTTPLHLALTDFISFLRRFDRPLLAAHNAKRFDAPVLARVLEECSLSQDFQEATSGFLDTFLLSKRLFASQMPRYSQEYLVHHFLGKSYDAHNALEDAKALKELYSRWSPSSVDVQTCTFQLPAVWQGRGARGYL